jgi:uncharacterized NAD-dependent epimerase/dehydratase family protein
MAKLTVERPFFLIIGTSAEVGKTTAGIAVLRALRRKGHTAVTALKATGTSSLTEILRYQDFGAVQASIASILDCQPHILPAVMAWMLSSIARSM